MKEQEIIDLGFEMQNETVENSGADTDWHYYTIDIGDICLITNGSDEAVKDGWEVSIFNAPSCVFKATEDLEDLIKIIQNNSK